VKELINILRSGIALTKLVDPRAYLVFVPMLIKAIQELSAKNNALEARIAALEGAQA
jgi:hypothetical protein